MTDHPRGETEPFGNVVDQEWSSHELTDFGAHITSLPRREGLFRSDFETKYLEAQQAGSQHTLPGSANAGRHIPASCLGGCDPCSKLQALSLRVSWYGKRGRVSLSTSNETRWP